MSSSASTFEASSSDQTMRLIIQAADAILRDDGTAGLTLRRVASAAGVSLGTLNYYFQSRGSLIDAVLEQENEQWAEELREFTAGALAGQPLPELIEQVVRRRFRAQMQTRARGRLRTSTVLSGGALSRHGQGRFTYSLHHQASRVLATALGLPEIEVRLRVNTVGFAVGRYAMFYPEELCELLGVTDARAAERRAEEHLVQLALELLVPPSPR